MTKLFAFFLLLLTVLAASAQNDSSIIVLQHANVIDGISNKPLRNITVTIEKGKITKVEKHGSIPSSNAIIINLTDKWLLPGFVDGHVHLSGFEAARTALASGVTTVRTMQCDHFIDLSIRDAHRKGQADLPDIIAAGYQIRPDMSDAFYLDFPELTDLKPKVSGTENLRRIVRALVSRNVDHIKILATERAGTPDTDPQKRTFTDEELIAVVDEAKKAGLFVAAHAHGDEGAAAAVRAGVRSIEHGSFMSDQTLRMMKSNGTYFSPTFSFWTEAATRRLYKENSILAERVRAIPLHGKGVAARAFKMGIAVVAGTDMTYAVPGITFYNEAIQLQEAGLPVMEIIKAMTFKSAQCLNVNNYTGAIKKGLDADMVIIGQNPLENITALQDIRMIINNGKIIINKLQ
jgi:imidazolonepropionase-like amidohydrolase